MTIAEQLASAEDKLLESEIGRNIPKFARTGASFRQTENGVENRRQRISVICCGGYQKPRWAKSTVSLVSFKRSGENYRPMATALNETIAKYAELNQQVMQLTAIISDGVKKLPGASGISR